LVDLRFASVFSIAGPAADDDIRQCRRSRSFFVFCEAHMFEFTVCAARAVCFNLRQ